MKHITIILILASLCAAAEKLKVLTGIPAQNEAVTAIAGELVDVQAMLPPGASPENYSPTARQLALCSEAKIMFTIGVPMEKAIVPRLKRSFPALKISDTTKGMIFRDLDNHHNGHGRDPHVWLSVKNMRTHAINIAAELKLLMPQHAAKLDDNLTVYLENLEKLHNEICTILAPLKGKTILVYHPAFGYLLDNAGIKQLAVEHDGREPTARHLAFLVSTAKKLECKAVFVQPQSNPETAARAAKMLNRKNKTLSPVPEEYSRDMIMMAKDILDGFKK